MIYTSINEFAQSIKWPREITIVYLRTAENTYSSIDKKFHSNGNLTKKLQEQFGAHYNYNSSKTEKIVKDGQECTVHTVLIAPKFSLRNENNLSKEKMKQYADELTGKLGMKVGYPQFYADYLDAAHRDYKAEYERKRKEEGFVVWKYSSKDMETKDYVGGFDLETFFNEELISYVERGPVFGYIGHTCRKAWVDRLLSEICMGPIKPADFAMWLTSTGGRHFGDMIYDMVVKDDQKAVREYIEKNLSRIHDQAVIYNSPEHRGNLSSTIELFGKYKDMGIMMGDVYQPF